MNVSIVKPEEIPQFVHGMNQAFMARADDHIPYKKTDLEEFKCRMNENSVCFGLYENTELIGGLVARTKENSSATISHVWISTGLQNMGGGTTLLRGAEPELRNMGYKYLYLSAANCYQPAVRLYKKLGFRPIGITANVPNTFYFLDMVKAIGPYKYPEGRRLLQLAVSCVKFRALFDKYSTPNFLHRLIYGKGKD